ncbi:hypothetical protein K440DRAFT_642452 [Wilcoxina mikolae CBS 423.85]|nr:hypothetical protein K440DRAFT_642452 [Wilcoxina mikolae CBS 423.85]
MHVIDSGDPPSDHGHHGLGSEATLFQMMEKTTGGCSEGGGTEFFSFNGNNDDNSSYTIYHGSNSSSCDSPIRHQARTPDTHTTSHPHAATSSRSSSSISPLLPSTSTSFSASRTLSLNNTGQGVACSGLHNSKSGLSTSTSTLPSANNTNHNPPASNNVTAMQCSSMANSHYDLPSSSPLSATAGPSLNLAEDLYARSREEAWPTRVRATTTKMPTNSGSMHCVGQIEGRYKGGVSDHPIVVEQHHHLQPVKEDRSYPQQRTRTRTSTSTSGVRPPNKRLHSPNGASAVDSTHQYLPITSNSSDNNIPPVSPQLPPTPAAISSSVTPPTACAKSARSKLKINTKAHSNTPASRSINQPKILHRRQSRELSSVRRSLVGELRASKSMEECHRPSSIGHDLDDILRCTQSQNDLSHMVAAATTEVSRYSNHHHQHHHLFMADGVSNDNLHAEYTYNSELIHSRPHSLSSLQANPIHESPNNEVDEDDNSDGYSVRRASTSTFVELPRQQNSYSHHTPEEFTQATAWAVAQQAFTPEHSIAESPHAPWWSDVDGNKQRIEAWTQHENHTLESSSPPQEQHYHHHHDHHNSRPSPAASFGSDNTMMYIRQPPSPLLDNIGGSFNSTCLTQELKSPIAVPSPPESPGFPFSSSADLSYQQTQTWPGGYSNQSQYEAHQRRASIPPTPPSRPPSRNTKNTNCVIAAVSAALKKPKSSSAPLASPSRRKTSSSSLRTKQRSTPEVTVGEMSFVNYTPNDAFRILNGVAPSGSSKTKARREREAMEKRRKLSEAAAAAVIAVGGDASALANVGLV